MPLPRAVREQAERAEAAHLALLNTPPGAQEQPPAEVPPQEVETPPAETPPAPPEPPTPQPPADPAPQPQPDAWELKYRVLQGKYNTEVPSLQAKVRELNAKVQELEASSNTSTPITPSEVVDRYGEDFASAVAAIVAPRLDQVQTRVDTIAQNTATSSRSAFVSELRTLVPNFQQIDADPGFTAYLDEFLPEAGTSRREFFNAADEANDAARIASFFTGYLGSKRKTPAPAPAPAPTTPSEDRHIVPDSSRSTKAPQGKKVWTTAEMNTFYKNARPSAGAKQYGLYTAAEYESISREIDIAIAEGRMR